MKQSKPVNKFDNLVDAFAVEFAKVKNFDLMTSDEVGSKVFNIITFRISDIHAYKTLVCNHFIPATNKAIFDAKKDFGNSKYKALLKPNEIDFKETLYDTIRLAYVGLFHKLENYINDVAKIPEMIFGEVFETDTPVVKWAKDKFQFDIKDWKMFSICHRINWICNCVKHYDGFPIKNPKPYLYDHLDVTKRITLTAEDFKSDCDQLIKVYPFYLQMMLAISQHKLLTEKPLIEEERKFSPDLYQQQLQNREELEKKMIELMAIIKDFQ